MAAVAVGFTASYLLIMAGRVVWYKQKVPQQLLSLAFLIFHNLACEFPRYSK